MSDTHIQNPNLHSEQEIFNESFNNTYKIIETALYLYQANSNTFVPGKADASGNLQIAGSFSATTTKSTVGTASAVALSTTTATVLASNANRLGATIFNEGTATAYLSFAATASTTAYAIQIASLGYYELPANYTGALAATTIAGTATLRVTELT